jgi:DNA-damage-inducible protein J
MCTNAVVRARIDETINERAATVLSTMGLTVSDAVRIMLTRIARDEALPFDLAPNALTAETLRRSELGEDVHYAKDADALFKDLDI